MEKVYLDSNIFIYAILDKFEKGNRARKFLRKVNNGEIDAYTSCLTYDEVLWIVKKNKTKEDVLNASKSFLHLGIKLLPVNIETLWSAQDIISIYNLDPRDAIHVAVCINNNIKNFSSEDKDFDKVKEIKRKGL
tara:strand:+ start:1028 stop:1429 length:402 start_codon:yes stop_codon:yes gene_type:complete